VLPREAAFVWLAGQFDCGSLPDWELGGSEAGQPGPGAPEVIRRLIGFGL